MSAAGAFDSRYEILRPLGRGGLGEVYLAHDGTLGRDVAIKFVRSEKFAGAEGRRALLREARAAAALDHPFICTVYEAGETDDGRGFIVMQYVEGQTLSAVLQQGVMPVRDALVLCAEVAEALGVAHRRGIIHRDLKPGNIMVTPSGRPKLVDFGIAKIVPSTPPSTNGSTTTATATATSTATAAMVGTGTPAYMSPEQAQGRALDGRSDLFSLGLVLFECLSGRRAFRAATPLATIADILHLHPPAPSTLRAGLTEAHDELCRRLISKDPSDRFQSADEVVGAIRVLLPDTSRTPLPRPDRAPARPARLSRRTAAFWAAAAIALVGVSASTWIWNRGGGLPAVPKESEVWYRQGTEALREGAYLTARRALTEAVRTFPEHALAYARLAEVDAELDDPQAAREHLLRVSALVPDESRLPDAERLRLQAVRAHVLRDVDGSIRLYRDLVSKVPGDAGSLVDLGRVQEAAGRRSDARTSYEQAIARDSQYAAAYLRLGRVAALESRRKESLEAFAEAERLYQARSDVEGETEVLYSRGAALDALGELKDARTNLERALLLATTAASASHQIRIQLALSSVTASEGRNAESRRIAEAAVAEAEKSGLDIIAANGLVTLAATLLFAGDNQEAERVAQRAIHLAEQRGAPSSAARAKVQLAAVYQDKGRSRDSLALVNGVLPFIKANRYRRLELTALSIAARDHQNLGELEQARQISSDVLAVAETVNDEGQAAIAATSLAGVTTALGQYPDALRFRERADAIHRRQGDQASLPFDLTHRAELLIRLGRAEDADTLLAEVDAGIAAKVDTYVARRRRVDFLRALKAAIALRCADALPLLDRVEEDRTSRDAATVLAPAIRAYCDARLGRRAIAVADPPAGADPAFVRERQYWLAAGALQRQDDRSALAAAAYGLTLLGNLTNDELRWRLAAVGAVAARRAGDQATADQLSSMSRAAWDRLRAAWQADFASYDRRLDLADLRKKEQA